MAADFEGGDGPDIEFGTYVRMYGKGGDDQLGSDATVFTRIYGGDDDDTVFYTGSATAALYGDGGNDSINGGALDDKIFGGGGNDWMFGGLGRDILKGEGGKDHFGFASVPVSAADRDVIKDFSVKKDFLNFVPGAFTAATPGESLLKSEFRLGAKAKDSDDFFGYDRKSGIVWYDSNGDQDGSQVEIAKLSKDLHLTHVNFQF